MTEILAHIGSCCNHGIGYCGTPVGLMPDDPIPKEICIVCSTFDAFLTCGQCARAC